MRTARPSQHQRRDTTPLTPALRHLLSTSYLIWGCSDALAKKNLAKVLVDLVALVRCECRAELLAGLAEIKSTHGITMKDTSCHRAAYE